MKKILCVFMVGVLFASGCDVLNVEPVSGITGAGYWQSPGDLEGYLIGIYASLRDEMNTTYYLADRSDAFVEGLIGPASDAWKQNLTPENAPNWVDFYNLIHHCNLLLKHGKDIPFEVRADKDRVLAETHFIRAFTYFLLIRAWGDVPLVLQPTESDDQPMPARAPTAKVMQQILKDINKAIALFPEDGFVHRSRASKPAVYALKAHALLWKAKVLEGGNQDLENALTALNEVISTPGLALEADFAQIFATDNRNNEEVIFSLHFERDEKEGHYSSRFKPFSVFVESAINADEIAHAGNGRARAVYAPSPKIIAALNDYSNDQRKDKTIIKAVFPDGEVRGVFDNKMRGTLYPDDRHYDNDIIVYRLGGILLLKAEVLAALGRIPQAVAALNKVRNRAGIGNYSGPMDQQSVELEILEERFRELWLELKRWPDLLRFHFAGTIDVYEVVPNLRGTNVPLFFPIPRSLIDINPNLEQTKGY